jgi:hypothetical protein
MARKDKKNRTCERCGHQCATPQKLREHLNRKNPCRPCISPVLLPQHQSTLTISRNPEVLHIPEMIQNPELLPEQNSKILLENVSQVVESETHGFTIKNANDRLSGETVKQWGSRLRKRYKELTYENYEQPRTLKACQVLYDTLLQIDEEAYSYIEPTKQTKEEQEFFGEPEIEAERQVSQPIIEPAKSQVIDSSKAGPGPKTQAYRERKNKQSEKIPLEADQTNEEFERLSMITGDHEKSIVFREQNLGRALKRRAVAVHNAKVPRYHPDNGSDIRKMLESQRKPFKELLEKEFDKRGQFKFSLCSLTKFLVDNKPGDKEKDKKKNTRTDWLRNKQIIVYNRSEIDVYLSNAFEQILYQVEERGGKTNN